MAAVPKDVRDYLASLTDDRREDLAPLDSEIRAAVPDLPVKLWHPNPAGTAVASRFSTSVSAMRSRDFHPRPYSVTAKVQPEKARFEKNLESSRVNLRLGLIHHDGDFKVADGGIAKDLG